MKLLYLISAILIFGDPIQASAQIPDAGSIAHYLNAEQVILLTDRSIYISGERIHFSTGILQPDTTIHESQDSKVLYAEVITPEGKSIVNGKFPITDYLCKGYLEIPVETITGVYYIRAYTRYMRNQGPESYAYLAIRIINPNKADVLRGQDTLRGERTQLLNDSQPLTFSPDKEEYKSGDEVTINFIGSALLDNAVLFNLTIVPVLSYNRTLPGKVNSNNKEEIAVMCKETRGLTISGVLKAGDNNHSIAGSRLNLSVIGDGKDFMAMDTDAEGRFFFTLPGLNGWRDLYLGTTSTAPQSVRILADNDFCSLPVKLPSPIFTLTDDERKLAITMAANTIICRAYLDSVINRNTTVDRPFYGTPDQVLVLSEYVQLPTLEEYFNELPGLVKVRISNSHKYFKVTGMQPEMVIYAPLVLVDYVAVDDPDQVLSASPSSVDRIEMINQPYLKGDILYGGVVSIISKRGDFAGIDLPASGTFINYKFFNEMDAVDYTPDTNSPDARNTVFYGLLPESVDGKYGPVSFTIPATPGSYQVVLTEVDSQGSIREHRKAIEVR